MLKLKQNKGITLIALIITIIVMLILVGVTVNVALNGGLFPKAETATRETEEKAILEEMIAMMEIDDNGKIKPDEIISNMKTKHSEYEIDDSNKPNIIITGKLGRYNYVVSETEIKIGIEQDNLTILREELEGKLPQEIMDENGKFLNSDIILLESDETSGVVSYKGEKYLLKVGENDSGNFVIISVERYNESAGNGENSGNLVTGTAYGTEDLTFIITSDNELIAYTNGTVYKGSDVGYSLYVGKINEHTDYASYTINDGLENSNKFIFNSNSPAYALSSDGEKLIGLYVTSSSISDAGVVVEKNTTLDVESIINSIS